MTALRSIANARGMLDEIASTQPLTNPEAIELAHAYARLSHAEAALKSADAAKSTAAGISDAVDVLQALQNPASKALEAARVTLGVLQDFLKASWPRQRPASGGSTPTPAPMKPWMGDH